jgi:hypothetical protein
MFNDPGVEPFSMWLRFLGMAASIFGGVGLLGLTPISTLAQLTCGLNGMIVAVYYATGFNGVIIARAAGDQSESDEKTAELVAQRVVSRLVGKPTNSTDEKFE